MTLLLLIGAVAILTWRQWGKGGPEEWIGLPPRKPGRVVDATANAIIALIMLWRRIRKKVAA